MNRPMMSNSWLKPHDTQDKASLQLSQTAITQNTPAIQTSLVAC